MFCDLFPGKMRERDRRTCSAISFPHDPWTKGKKKHVGCPKKYARLVAEICCNKYMQQISATCLAHFATNVQHMCWMCWAEVDKRDAFSHLKRQQRCLFEERCHFEKRCVAKTSQKTKETSCYISKDKRDVILKRKVVLKRNV